MGAVALYAFSEMGINPDELPTDITINSQPLFPEDERGILQVPGTLHSVTSGYRSVAEEFQAGSSVALRWTEPTLVNRLLDPIRNDKRSDRVVKRELLAAGVSEDQANALVDFRKSVKLTKDLNQLHIHRTADESVVHVSFRVDAVAMDSGIPVLAQGVQVVGGVTQFTIGPLLKGAGEVLGTILSPFGVKDEVKDIFATPDKMGRLLTGNGEAWVTVAIDTAEIGLDSWHLFLNRGNFETLIASLDSTQAAGI